MVKQKTPINGNPISPGVALGEIQVVRDSLFHVVRRILPASQVRSEVARLEEATKQVINELNSSKNKAVNAIGEPGANVFEAQIMIASDIQFYQTVVDRITSEKVNAEFAYQEALTETLERLRSSGDVYIRQMIYDIRAVSERLLSIMMGIHDGYGKDFKHPTILVGRVFSPGQIIAYSKRNVVGFLTQEGSPASHMGLILRSLGIPAVNADFDLIGDITPGSQIIVDGNNGEVYIDPDPPTWRNYRRIRMRKKSQPFAILLKSREIDAECLDGRRITLAANLEIPGPMDEHLVRLGVGVGLYRTEFLYFSKQRFPDEDEQYEVYSSIARKFNPLPVTLRTFDLGGDKYAAELGTIREDNPALGWRGIRVSLESPTLFKAQLRAMYRASAHGNLRILLPMVSDVADIKKTLDLIDKIKRDLHRSNIEFDDDVPVGAMIEVPAAALSADYLAEKVDFFSIGTNDLIQYTMAADRGNYRVTKYYAAHHPAVINLIARTIQAAHENGIPVSVCGETAGSRTMTPLLVGLGIDELSMAPTQLPVVADWINRFKYIDAKRFASRVLRLSSAERSLKALREAYDFIKDQKKGNWLNDIVR